MILSLVSCGTAPFCQHWQRTSCSGSNNVVLQCLIKLGGIPSLPGALTDAKLSKALLSSSTDGSGGQAFDYIYGFGIHDVLSGIEVRIVFHPSLHLLACVCDYLPIRGIEGRRLALGRTQCLLHAIIHSPDVPSYGGCIYILAELCPILVCTSPRGLLNLVSGSSDNLQVPFAGWLIVLNQGGALSFDDGSHFGRLVVKPVVNIWGLVLECSQGCAVHGVSENFPLLCGRIFGMWHRTLSQKPPQIVR